MRRGGLCRVVDVDVSFILYYKLVMEPPQADLAGLDAGANAGCGTEIVPTIPLLVLSVTSVEERPRWRVE